MDFLPCNTKIPSDVQTQVQKQPVFYTWTCFPAPLWIMCINLFQFYKRIHPSEFLQALKISLLLYVLASTAPAGAAMAVSEHTQDFVKGTDSLCTGVTSLLLWELLRDRD